MIPLGTISMSYPVTITYKGTFAPRVNWRSKDIRHELKIVQTVEFTKERRT